MAKEVIESKDARIQMAQGIDLLARAVSVTFGPAGPSVIIQHRTAGLPPVISRDGVTVANAISLEDPIADLGARMLRDVANSVSREAGDGTTGSIVLAHRMAKEALKSITAGADPMQIKKGMDKACALVVENLRAQAADGTTEEVMTKIGTISSREKEVGVLIAGAVKRLGNNCILNIEMGDGREDVLEVIEGIQYNQGYASPQLVTDNARHIAELENPLILFYDEEIHNIDQLIPAFEIAGEEGRPLLIVSEGLIDAALSATVMNHGRGVIKVCAIKPPGYGDHRPARLMDLAMLTGGKVFLKANGEDPENVTLEDFGQATKAIIKEEITTIIGGVGDKAAIAERIVGLKKEAHYYRNRKPGEGSPTGNLHEAEDLEERIANLSGAIGVVHVGGCFDIEIKERMVRVENAWNSVSAAIEEGVVPGGGAALFRSRKVLESLKGANPDQDRGIAVLREALAAPIRLIATNAGLSADVVQHTLSLSDDPFGVFDASTETYGNAYEKGVLDATKVIRLALEKSVGIIGTMLTSETVISAIRDTTAWDSFDPKWAAETREDPRLP